jgi:ATP-dependent DNA ligase
MVQRRRPSGFIEPCLPSKVARPPSGPLWVHEIKHDGYRLMVRRDGERVRCFTKGGHDWAALPSHRGPLGAEEGDEWAASPEGQAPFEKLYRR